MSLNALERETVITFNDAEDMAQVHTHQRPVITKMKKNPTARLIEEGVFETTPWARFEIPKNMLSFRSKERKATPGSGAGFAAKTLLLEKEL
jgi:hypothetical protein